MRVDRLGKLFEQKYSLQALAAGESEGPLYPAGYIPKSRGPQEYSKPGVLPQVTFPLPNMKDVDAKIRNSLDQLWKIPSNQYNVLRACADANVKNPTNDIERNAQKGFWFCRDVLSIVDWLKANRNKATLSEIKEALVDLVNLIKENIDAGGPQAQFMHVSDLIPFLLRHLKTNVRNKEILVQRNKVKHGLSHIMSKSLDIINYMNELGGASKMTGRFTPQPTETLDEEKKWFFKNYGDQFGIPDLETWAFVTNTDPTLVPFLAKLIRTLIRPYKAAALRQAPKIKAAINSMIRKAQLAKATNMPYLERIDPLLFEFEESGESPSVLSPQQLQRAIQKRDIEHQQNEEALQERIQELKEDEKQIEEDRERHVRKDGTSILLDQLLKGAL